VTGRTGGKVHVKVTSEPLDLAAAGEIVETSDGALVSFAGVVRNSSEGGAVLALEYEAYGEMAEQEMQRIAEEACGRFDVDRIAILHRVGRLEVGEVSVVVAVSAPHRGPAFDACEFCIDTLKQRVPIWKKELFTDGSASWAKGS
ncbi:MAG: molybdenum cofactor biosynthesis protein MoaE, partial [Actinomycetota bacterium]